MMYDVWENHNTGLKRSMFYKTKLWRKRKKDLLVKANFTCQRCGLESKNLEAHHIRNNEEIGHDKPEDLVVLCHSCHEKEHGRKLNYNYRGKYKTNREE